MKSTEFSYRCAVIGDWHLAFITAVCLSSLGHKTVLVNPRSDQESRWAEFPKLSLHEPRLDEMISCSRAEGLLDFVSGIDASWSAEFVWLAIDTPVNERDEADTTSLEQVILQVVQNGNAHGPFVITSQIPVGFSSRLEHCYPLTIAYVPENLRLGKGIETFLKADRMVIGSSNPNTAKKVQDLLKDIPTSFVICDLATAEMIKHATNAFLATSISFANEMARIGEKMGVDNQLVGRALKLDQRIGKQAYVMPGMGFAGGTLPRDLRILQKVSREHQIKSPLVDAVLKVNESTVEDLTEALRSFFGSLRGKRILILGYTYKAETDTLRRSSSLDLASRLVAEGVLIEGFDPVMNFRDLNPLKGLIRHYPSWEKIENLPDAVVIMTPRPEFANLDWIGLSKKKVTDKPTPRLVLDTWGVTDTKEVLSAGLDYKALWQPIQRPLF